MTNRILAPQVTLIAVLMMLVGCATQPNYQWIHPTANQQIFDRDAAQCDYESSASTQQTDYSLRTVFGQEFDRAIRKKSLYDLCMRARGYAQQQVSR